MPRTTKDHHILVGTYTTIFLTLVVGLVLSRHSTLAEATHNLTDNTVCIVSIYWLCVSSCYSDCCPFLLPKFQLFLSFHLLSLTVAMSTPSCQFFLGYLYICFLGGTIALYFWQYFVHDFLYIIPGHIQKMQKNGSLFHHVCLSVSLCTWNTASSTGQISVKIYIEDFLIKISEPEVWLKLDKHEAYTTGLYNGDRLCSQWCTVWRQTFNNLTITNDIESVLWEVWAKCKEKVNVLSITVKHEWLILLSRAEQTWRHGENL